jgi:predicted permease
MGDLLGIIAPVFALIALGHAAVRLRLLDRGGLQGLTDFVFFAALPALLFGAITDAPSLRVADVAGVYFAACAIVYAVAMLLARLMMGSGLAQAAMIGLNASFGNTVLLGVPIATAAFGPDAVPPLMAVIALHSALLLPLATMLIEAGAGGGRGPFAILAASVRGVARNPIIVSIAVALLWRLSGIVVPTPLHRFAVLLGGAASPVALFCLGASLPGFAGRGVLTEAVLASTLKLLILPAMVFTLGHAAGLSGLPLSVAVLTAGMPTGANAFLLARRASTLIEASASTVVMATVLSVVTLALLLARLR